MYCYSYFKKNCCLHVFIFALLLLYILFTVIKDMAWVITTLCQYTLGGSEAVSCQSCKEQVGIFSKLRMMCLECEA